MNRRAEESTGGLPIQSPLQAPVTLQAPRRMSSSDVPTFLLLVSALRYALPRARTVPSPLRRAMPGPISLVRACWGQDSALHQRFWNPNWPQNVELVVSPGE